MQLKIAKDEAIEARDEAVEARGEAEKSRDEAVRANNAKTHFIQNMTHEIHTPINAIYGFASLLVDPTMDGMFDKDSLMEMYKAISDSSMNLSAIIDNIITITDFEAPVDRPVMKPIDLPAIIEEAMTVGVQPDASLVNYHCDYSALPSDLVLVGNTAHTKRILENLLHNAIKFTQQGEIFVLAHPSQDNTAVIVEVRDTGIGIPEDKGELIFERYKKLDEYVPGTGLGLTVCRAIAGIIGAEVYCDMEHTKLGEGSTFILRLPLGLEEYEGSKEHFSYNEHLGSY